MHPQKNNIPFRKDKSFKVQGSKFRILSLAIELNVAYIFLLTFSKILECGTNGKNRFFP